ncbi:Dap [Columba livia]|nr:Dap [Columba livia]
MSSPPKEKVETRAGHPPAVKAGGMRIVQKHPHNSDAKEEKDKDDQDWETSNENLAVSVVEDTKTVVTVVITNLGDKSWRRNSKTVGYYYSIKGEYHARTRQKIAELALISPPKPTVFISGVIARGDKDFPPAAAQVAHQKPHPSVEKLPHPQHVKQHIHQPRK